MMPHSSLLVLAAVMSLSQAAGEDRSFRASPSGRPTFWNDRLRAWIAAGRKLLVFETIGNYERHSVYLVLRGKTSAAELHETEADLHVVRRPRAILRLGGELVDAELRPRKQQRGSSIRGGIQGAATIRDDVVRHRGDGARASWCRSSFEMRRRTDPLEASNIPSFVRLSSVPLRS